MAYNEIGKKSTDKYRAKFDFIQIRVEQGERAKISEHAKIRGESINGFINRAIKETMDRDNSVTEANP